MSLVEKVNTFGELANVAYDAVGEVKEKTVTDVFRALTQVTRSIAKDPGFGTPVDTGTLRFNWRASPVVGPYKKEYHKSNSFGFPDMPDMKKYTNRWKHFYIYNNSEYLASVDSSDRWLGFVEDTVKKALANAD